MLSHLSPENRKHHDDVRRLSMRLDPRVHEDHRIVRGLDYYTRTVFEIHVPELGARSAVCGGGRYDHLVRDLGGPDLGAVGFAVGFTPTMVAMRELGIGPQQESKGALVFIVAAGEGLEDEVFRLAEELRAAKVSCVYDVEQRSLKNQMKQAGKGGHRYALVLGGDELARGSVQLKDLELGEQHELPRAELVARLRAGAE